MTPRRHRGDHVTRTPFLVRSSQQEPPETDGRDRGCMDRGRQVTPRLRGRRSWGAGGHIPEAGRPGQEMRAVGRGSALAEGSGHSAALRKLRRPTPFFCLSVCPPARLPFRLLKAAPGLKPNFTKAFTGCVRVPRIPECRRLGARRAPVQGRSWQPLSPTSTRPCPGSCLQGAAHTWRLEVNAPHFHGVLGVVRGQVGVVEQAFGAGFGVLAFALWGARGRCAKGPRGHQDPRRRTQGWGRARRRGGFWGRHRQPPSRGPGRAYLSGLLQPCRAGRREKQLVSPAGTGRLSSHRPLRQDWALKGA